MLGHLNRPTVLAALAALLLVLANSATAAPLIDRRAGVALGSHVGQELVTRAYPVPGHEHPGRVPYKTPIGSAEPYPGVNDPKDPPRRKPHPPKREELEARGYELPDPNDPNYHPPSHAKSKPHPPKREELEARGYGRLPPEVPDPIDPYYHPPPKPKKPHPPKREEIEARGPIHGPISPPVVVPGDEPIKHKPHPPQKRDVEVLPRLLPPGNPRIKEPLRPGHPGPVVHVPTKPKTPKKPPPPKRDELLERGRELGGSSDDGKLPKRDPPKEPVPSQAEEEHYVKRGRESGVAAPATGMPPEGPPTHEPDFPPPPRKAYHKRGRENGHSAPPINGPIDLAPPGDPRHPARRVIEDRSTWAETKLAEGPSPLRGGAYYHDQPDNPHPKRGREAGHVPPKGSGIPEVPGVVFPPEHASQAVPPLHKSHPPRQEVSKRGREVGSSRPTAPEPGKGQSRSPPRNGIPAPDENESLSERGREAGHVGRKTGGISSSHQPPVADPHEDPPSKGHPPREQFSKRGRENGQSAPPTNGPIPLTPPGDPRHPERRAENNGKRDAPQRNELNARQRFDLPLDPQPKLPPLPPIYRGGGNGGKKKPPQRRDNEDLPPPPKTWTLPPSYKGREGGSKKKPPQRRSVEGQDGKEPTGVANVPPEQKGRGKRPHKRSESLLVDRQANDDDSPSHRDHKPREPHPRREAFLGNRQANNDDDDSPSHRDHKPREPHPRRALTPQKL